MIIDWENPICQITTHFTVKDALWLPTWGRLANETDGLDDVIKTNLIQLYTTCMEPLRDVLGPIIAHVTYRPPTYNKLIGGASNSAHMYGKAMDWHAANHSIDDAKNLILQQDLLNKLNIRMEKNTITWIHTDNVEIHPGHNRYFLP